MNSAVVKPRIEGWAAEDETDTNPERGKSEIDPITESCIASGGRYFSTYSSRRATGVSPPAIYLDPDYQRELRRRAAIIKEFSGQDFTPAIDELVKEAQKQTPR